MPDGCSLWRTLFSPQLLLCCCVLLVAAPLLAQPSEGPAAEPQESAEEAWQSPLVADGVRNFLWQHTDSEVYQIELVVFQWLSPRFAGEIMAVEGEPRWDEQLVDLNISRRQPELVLPPIDTAPPLPRIEFNMQQLMDFLEQMRARKTEAADGDPDAEAAEDAEDAEDTTSRTARCQANSRLTMQWLSPGYHRAGLPCRRADHPPADALQPEPDRRILRVQQNGISPQLPLGSDPIAASAIGATDTVRALEEAISSSEPSASSSEPSAAKPELPPGNELIAASGFFWPPLHSEYFFTLLPLQQHSLLGTALSRMRRAGLFRILSHKIWMQPLTTSEQSLKVRLFLPAENGLPLVHGFVWAYKQRFLHVEMDLRLQTWNRSPIAPTDPVADPLGTRRWRNWLRRFARPSYAAPISHRWQRLLYSVPAPVPKEPQVPQEEQTVSSYQAQLRERHTGVFSRPTELIWSVDVRMLQLYRQAVPEEPGDWSLFSARQEERAGWIWKPEQEEIPPLIVRSVDWNPDVFARLRPSADGFTARWRHLTSPAEMTERLRRQVENRPPLPTAFVDESFRIREERKIEEGQLHYFDHPAFGVMIVVKQVEPEDLDRAIANIRGRDVGDGQPQRGLPQ